MPKAMDVIHAYSGLEEPEKRKFEREFASLLRFRKDMENLADTVSRMTPAQAERALKRMQLKSKKK